MPAESPEREPRPWVPPAVESRAPRLPVPRGDPRRAGRGPPGGGAGVAGSGGEPSARSGTAPPRPAAARRMGAGWGPGPGVGEFASVRGWSPLATDGSWGGDVATIPGAWRPGSSEQNISAGRMRPPAAAEPGAAKGHLLHERSAVGRLACPRGSWMRGPANGHRAPAVRPESGARGEASRGRCKCRASRITCPVPVFLKLRRDKQMRRRALTPGPSPTSGRGGSCGVGANGRGSAGLRHSYDGNDERPIRESRGRGVLVRLKR
jgi:hypothetical protein